VIKSNGAFRSGYERHFGITIVAISSMIDSGSSHTGSSARG
jgi:hypothetical protein